MAAQPILATARLVLRPFEPADAPEVRRLAGERDIASMTLTIPHPYEPGQAESWIRTHAGLYEAGEGIVFAIARKEDRRLVGATGLRIDQRNLQAEIGYWIGRPYRRNGYASEAAAALVRHAFNGLGLRRVIAHHFARNPASGRVLEKIGMTREGLLRQHILKWDRFEDVVIFGILAEELPA